MIILDTKYFLMLLVFSAFFMVPISYIQAVSPYRYYAGYSSSNTPMGIKGNILTVDPWPPINELLGEWVNIYISYSPLYWVQTGYVLHWYFVIFWWVPTLDFYFEAQDSVGHTISYCALKPLVGHTYTYQIYYKQLGLYCWHFRIYEGQTYLMGLDSATNPHTYIDLAASVETSHTGTEIDGSHFTNLKYYTGSTWNLWNTHAVICSGPYYLQQISHYEFWAYGGG